MKKVAVFGMLGSAAIAALAVSTSPASAQAVVCGERYTVVRGDSLSGIAQRVYGSTSSFQFIYSANADIIGRNPEIIQIGQSLLIPCLDNTVASTADESTIRVEETTAALPAPDDRQIRFVTGTDWAPFSNEDQAQGGMMTEVVNVAMANADGSPEYKIDFINDWGAHFRPLIADHAYDMTFPWFRPNCDVIDRLSDGSQFRCNNLDWSEPLYEHIVGWYTRTTDPAPANHGDMAGKTICRPAAYSTFMIEEHNLMPPVAALEQPNGPTECFEALLAGTVDVVVIAADVGEDSIAKLNAAGQVQINDPLNQIVTLHAVIAKTHPDKERILAQLNSGIEKIKGDLRWFEIIKRHLTEHKAATES